MKCNITLNRSLLPLSEGEAVRQLNPAQLAHFRSHHYVQVPGFLDSGELEQITHSVERLLCAPEEPGKAMVYYEDDRRAEGRRIVSRIENFVPFEEHLQEFALGPHLTGIAADLLNEPVYLFKDKINLKLPGSAGFEWHQDAQAGWSEYGALHLNVMISLDPSDEANGCLKVAHGFRGAELVGEMWKPLDDSSLSSYEIVACQTAPGDAIFFDSYIPHGSSANTTESPRRALFLTFGRVRDGDRRAEYYRDKRKAFPPDIERAAGTDYVYRV